MVSVYRILRLGGVCVGAAIMSYFRVLGTVHIAKLANFFFLFFWGGGGGGGGIPVPPCMNPWLFPADG